MSDRTAAEQEDLIIGYVATAMELRERSEPIDVARLCAAHPDLVAQVTEALAHAGALPDLFDHSERQQRSRLLTPRYRLDDRIGAGAMGVVYRSTDLELRRPVAIKLLRSDLFDEPTAAARFAREAEALAALDHPNIVKVFDRGNSADGVAFLVMECIEGRSLAQLVADRDQPSARKAADEAEWLRKSVQWIADLAAALQVAHAKGILHRDIKPSNVLVGADGRARLLDFGIAASLNSATLTGSRDGTLGTPAYMAPEQLAERIKPSTAQDIYGLTATLYHLLAGRPPYLGTASQVLARMQRTDPMPIERARAGTPRDLAAIIDKGMSRAPSRRYATMADLQADLRAFLEFRAVRARPVSAVGRACRQGSRSPVVRTLGVIAGLAIVMLGVREWQHAARAARARRYEQADRLLPPSLTLESAAARRIQDPTERAALTELLDTLVECADDPLPRLNLRAAFRSDQLDLQGAAADAQTLARRYPSPVTAALATHYQADAERGTAEAIDPAALPEPASIKDRTLLAYYTLRRELTPTSAQRTIELFSGDDLTPHLASQELLVFAEAMLAGALVSKDVDAAADYNESARKRIDDIEAQRGYCTATSTHQRGITLLGDFRYEEALDLLTPLAERADTAPQLLNNLAIAQRNCGMYPEAIATCERVIRLRPRHPRPWSTLSRAYVDLGDYDRARTTISQMPVADGPGSQATARREAAQLELDIAFAHLANFEREDARSAAAKAVELFTAANLSHSNEARVGRALCGSAEEIFWVLVESVEKAPESRAAVTALAQNIPVAPTEEHWHALVKCLRATGEAHRPGRRNRAAQSSKLETNKSNPR